jgi:hypothetical protein
MGLLAPIYALAALAVVGPILFHLIRRQPQGQMQFSSLMFLTPSPPKLTRRSRLDNLWLLLLRAVAIGLIAVAFARPYLRQDSFLSNTLAGRRVVLLLDTSASMQRADVWTAAQVAGQELLDSLSPQDQVALYTIDSRLNTILALDDQGTTDPAASQQAARGALADLQPTWQPTALGDGLKSVADLITSAAIAGKIDPTAQSEVVLITDLHSGSQLETLQGFPWPEKIQLDVRRILPAVAGNARPSLMQAAEDEPAETEDTYRVRIENAPDSAQQTLRLAWANAGGELDQGMTTIQVPPGQVRVVPMTARPPRADRIQLSGDAWEADNAAFVVEPVVLLERIVYCGTPSLKPEQDLGYFLEQAPLGTELVRREVQRATTEELELLLAEPETQAVVLEPLVNLFESAGVLKKFVRGGGVVIVCLSRPLDDPSAVAAWLEQLLEIEQLTIAEAESREFALLAQIDFQHPLFAPLSDPRFNDFGKLRFWSHRNMVLPAESPVRSLATFDDKQPLLLERSLDSGRIWVMSAGWQPAASGLGLSSKFIPILMGMLDPQGRTRKKQLVYQVGEKMDVADLGDLRVLDAQRQPIDSTQFQWLQGKLSIVSPGLFWLEGEELQRQVAIQIPTSESSLTPLDLDQFAQYGIGLGKVATDRERRESLRQLQVTELESKQRLWQWLIAGCLVVLAMETFLAGWLNRR